MADLADLPLVAAGISRDLAAEGIQHAVSGAIAMAAHGFVRATRDIDILVVVPALRLPAALEVVRRHGFAGEDRALLESLRTRFVAEMRAGPATVEILVPVLPYHHEVFRRAVRIETGGVAVPFVTPEDLVVLKMLWLRDKDRADVRALLAARKGSLDAAYVRRTLDSLLPPGDGRVAEFERMRGQSEGSGADPATL